MAETTGPANQIYCSIERPKGFIGGFRQRVMKVELETQALSFSNMVDQLVHWQGRLAEDYGVQVDADESPDVDDIELFTQLYFSLYHRIHLAFHFPVFDHSRVVAAAEGKLALLLPYWDHQCSKAIVKAILGVSLEQPDRHGPMTQELMQRLMQIRVTATKHFRLLDGAYRAGMSFFELPVKGVQIGEAGNSRVFTHSVSDTSSSFGTRMAASKWSTARLLNAAGFPGADNRKVRSLDEALRAAEIISYPVVIKPDIGTRGEGVYNGLANPKEVTEFYKLALQYSSELLIEAHVPGNVYRITVAAGQVIKVSDRQPGGVRGDGTSTVEALLDQLLKTEFYTRKRHSRSNATLALDEEALSQLASSGMHPKSVPAPGQFVALRRKANVSAGGTATNKIDDIHEDNIQLAIDATRQFKLDFAGVDLITSDISIPWHRGRSIICEINANPMVGTGRTPDVFVNLLERMIPHGGRVPILLAVHFTSGKKEESVHEQIRQQVSEQFSRYALVCDDQIETVGVAPLLAGKDVFTNVNRCLMNNSLGAVAIFMDYEQLNEHGLPSQFVDHLVLTDPAAGDLEEITSLINSISPQVRGRILVADQILFADLEKCRGPDVYLLADHEPFSLLPG